MRLFPDATLLSTDSRNGVQRMASGVACSVAFFALRHMLCLMYMRQCPSNTTLHTIPVT